MEISDEHETVVKSQENKFNLDKAPTKYVIPSFSFSGCGFLGVYHVGVASCLRDHTDIVSRKEIKFAGASAGAIVAAALLLDLDFGYVTKILLELAKALHEKTVGNLGEVLRDHMNIAIPEDAHIRLRNRLYISITVLNVEQKGLQGGLVTNFKSKDHLIDCLIASSYVPGFLGWMPPAIEKEDIITYEVEFKALSGLNEVGHNTCATEEEREKGVEINKPNYFPDKDEFDSLSDKSDLSDTPETELKETLCCFYSNWESEICDNDENEIKEKMIKNKTYLETLVKLCFSSIRTTKNMVNRLPLASRLMNLVTPAVFDELNELLEAVFLEVLSDSKLAVDGGFSNNIPTFDINTVTVCPFSGESDICPQDLTGTDMCIRAVGTSMRASEDNLFRLGHALNPMHPEALMKLCEEGYNNCLTFLAKKQLLSCKKHLMTRVAISPSACNVGHAHCRCQLCKKAEGSIKESLSCIDCHSQKKKALSSVLPLPVRSEFQKAIDVEKKEKNQSVLSFLDRTLPLLWWFVEKFYHGVIISAELSILFSNWTMYIKDYLTWFKNMSVHTLSEKRSVLLSLLSSLLRTVGKFFKTKTQSTSMGSLGITSPLKQNVIKQTLC